MATWSCYVHGVPVAGVTLPDGVYWHEKRTGWWVVLDGDNAWLVRQRPAGWSARRAYKGPPVDLDRCTVKEAREAQRLAGVPGRLIQNYR